MSDNRHIAAAAQHFDAASLSSLYLVDNYQTASNLRAAFVAQLEKSNTTRSALLPQVLPIFSLYHAASVLPTSAVQNGAETLDWLKVGAGAEHHRRVTMEIDSLLREQWTNQNQADILPTASALAEVLVEFVEAQKQLIPDANILPQLCDKLPSPLADEGAIIAALWAALQDGHLLAARRGLQAFAQQATKIIYVGDVNCAVWLPDFLRQCKNGGVIYSADSKHQNNTHQNAPDNIGVDFQQIDSLINTNSQADSNSSPADAVAQVLRGEMNDAQAASHLPQTCQQGESASLSEAAEMALTAIRDYAAECENSDSIGVVVYDRLLARRLRAAAENAGIYIEDDGGWRVETLSFGGALQQWAETVIRGFSASRFARLLRPPFWYGQKTRGDALHQWQNKMKKGILPQSWAEAAELSAKQSAESTESAATWFVQCLYNAHRTCPVTIDTNSTSAPTAPLSEWMAWLLEQSTPALAAWHNDAVATSLRGMLNMAATESSPQSAESFLQYLTWFMQQQTGGERAIKSNIAFVTPSTQRQFARLILLGAHQHNLPKPPPHFLGEKRRVLLTLPGRSEHIAEQLHQFASLLANHQHISAVWYNGSEGARPTHPSPLWVQFIERMAAVGRTVRQIVPPPHNAIASLNLPKPAAAVAHRLPQTIAITALDNLMKCPYHFYAQNLLQLDDEDDDNESLNAMESGRLLHQSMKKFATDAVGRKDLESLRACWQDAFSLTAASKKQIGAKMALLHWREQGDDFLQKEWQRRADGWHIACAEELFSETLQTDLGEVRLRGKLDRLDHNRQENKWEVIDYKSGSLTPKTKLLAGEAPQLPMYAILSGHADALWRLCSPAKGNDTSAQGDAEIIANALRAVLQEIGSGAPMHANGTSAECRQCVSRRLCRRDHVDILGS